MGETIDAAVKRADKEKSELASFDKLGEAARTAEDAARYYASYAHAIARIGKGAKPGEPNPTPAIRQNSQQFIRGMKYLQPTVARTVTGERQRRHEKVNA